MLELIKDHLNVDAITGTQRVFKVGLDVEVDENLKHMNTNTKDQKKIQNESIWRICFMEEERGIKIAFALSSTIHFVENLPQ